jgi:hypothetical protein
MFNITYTIELYQNNSNDGKIKPFSEYPFKKQFENMAKKMFKKDNRKDFEFPSAPPPLLSDKSIFSYFLYFFFIFGMNLKMRNVFYIIDQIL